MAEYGRQSVTALVAAWDKILKYEKSHRSFFVHPAAAAGSLIGNL